MKIFFVILIIVIILLAFILLDIFMGRAIYKKTRTSLFFQKEERYSIDPLRC